MTFAALCTTATKQNQPWYGNIGNKIITTYTVEFYPTVNRDEILQKKSWNL